MWDVGDETSTRGAARGQRRALWLREPVVRRVKLEAALKGIEPLLEIASKRCVDVLFLQRERREEKGADASSAQRKFRHCLRRAWCVDAEGQMLRNARGKAAGSHSCGLKWPVVQQ